MRLEECDTNGRLKILTNDEILQKIHCYDTKDFRNSTVVASERSALVYKVYINNILKLAIHNEKNWFRLKKVIIVTLTHNDDYIIKT